MSVWRYSAIVDGVLQRGELAADSAAEVRASLRRAGLRVVEVKPIRRSTPTGPSAISRIWQRHIRTRRAPARAEVFDALATMIDAGIPLLEAIATMRRSAGARQRGAMLAVLHDTLSGGASLAEAMRTLPSWFEPAEVAMVEAGQSTGDLPAVLQRLADRRARAGELAAKLAAALTYPIIVLLVALGVTMFLSVKTLPDLVQILIEAEIDPPALTMLVMGFGNAVLRFGVPVLLGAGVLGLIAAVVLSLMNRRGWFRWSGMERGAPRTARRLAVAEALLSLSELTQTGVPLVDAVRIVAPTTPTWLALRTHLLHAADEVERGRTLAQSIGDPAWFDEEITQLIAVGETTGELDDVLERVGRREQRRARRLIDRLASLLEPAAILTLAVLVGTVLLAAVLPLLKLKEML